MKIQGITYAHVGGHSYTVVPCEFDDYTGNEPEMWPNLAHSKDLTKVNTWCWNTFGERGEPYDGPGIPHRWYQQKGVFWFRDEKDFEWFLLRWN